MKIELVVFDMAGTTVYDDDAVNACLRQALASDGVAVDRETVNSVMGEPKPIAIAKLLGHGRHAFSPEHPRVRAIFAVFEKLMLHFYEHDPMVCAVEDAAETFRILKSKGVRIALDTGFNRAIADTIVHRFAWHRDDLVDFVVTSDEVARGRPHPDMIERAMSLAGVGNCLAVAKVGDTPADLYEGTSARCGYVIGIATGTHTRAQLAAHPHTHLVERLAEVPPICFPLGGRPAGGGARQHCPSEAKRTV